MSGRIVRCSGRMFGEVLGVNYRRFSVRSISWVWICIVPVDVFEVLGVNHRRFSVRSVSWCLDVDRCVW